MDTDLDWARLGRAFKEGRDVKGLTQVQAADLIGVSKGPIQTIDRGVPHSRITSTMRAYARIVGWADGSIETVLDGGDPVPVEAAAEMGDESQGAGGAGSSLPRRIREELDDDGELLDTTVITLPGGGRALVVVKAREGATAAETEKSLKAWREDTEPHLKDLSVD